MEGVARRVPSQGDHGHMDRWHNEDVAADFPGGTFPSSQLQGERGGQLGNEHSVPGALWSIWCFENTISSLGSVEISLLYSLMAQITCALLGRRPLVNLGFAHRTGRLH